MRRPLISAAALLALAALGCGGKSEETPAPPRTPEQQRAVDSTIGASALPGAGGVRNALAASDSAAARKRVADSIAANP
jgi:predicted outer membrane protein